MSDESYPLIRRLMPFTTAALVIAALYAGFVFFSRWNASHEADQAKAAKEAEDARRTVEILGGRDFKITAFYGSPPAVHRGEPVNICYGTNEAQSVRIDPPVEELHPAVSHCLQVMPKKTTEYTLIAEDGKGHTAKSSFTIQVR